MTSRDLVRRFLGGSSTERPPVVMDAAPYAARLQQLTYRQASTDPTLLANSLQSAQKLFGLDGLVVAADAAALAEACGCAVGWEGDEPVVRSYPWAESDGVFGLPDSLESVGRLAVALEAARRLYAVVGREVAVYPSVAGPVTLAGLLRGPAFAEDLETAPGRAFAAVDAAATATMHVARHCFEMGPHAVVVADPALSAMDSSQLPRVAGALRTLFNVADFYDADVVLQTDAVAAAMVGDRGEPANAAPVDDLIALRAGGLFFACDSMPDGGWLAQAAAAASRPGGRGGRVVVGVPAALFVGEGPRLEDAAAAWSAGAGPAGAMVLVSRIPTSAPPENVHAVLRALRG